MDLIFLQLIQFLFNIKIRFGSIMKYSHSVQNIVFGGIQL